jgi:DNA-binding response OmpR family regulator
MNENSMILVIDDDAVLRSTLARILTRTGCQVLTAANGAEAISLLEQRVVDLVYLDIQLPEMNGLEVLALLRESYPGLPVILLTGYGTVQSAIQALRLGATDYLLKPLDPEVLLARTQIALHEVIVERRKAQLRSQISGLQAELHSLEQETLPTASYKKPVVSLSIPPVSERFIKRGKLVLDLQAQRATFQGRVLVLPPAAFDYLVVFVAHAPEVVTYQNLVQEAQGYQVNPGEARELSKWHVHVLRQALEDEPEQPNWLLNVRGVGYRLLLE